MTKLTEYLCCCCFFVVFCCCCFLDDPRGLSAPAHGLYTGTWPLFSNIFANQSQILTGASLGQGDINLYKKNGLGHMNQMAAMPIYGNFL